MTIRSRLLSILFWSVLSAAFIGPGTVTSAASAGANFGLTLLWALTFSTIACVVLQEASARITAVSGSNLGQALMRQYGASARVIPWFVMGAIILGCAAYQAGNILGAVAGLKLFAGMPRQGLTLAIGGFAFAVLWFGSTNAVANILGLIVAVLGLSFLSAAVALGPPVGDLIRGSLVPSMPEGAGLLVLALVGTTVVPYNLFLGSGLKHSQSLPEMRFGLAVAVMLGGVISMGILVVGTATAGAFTFEALSGALESRVGPAAPWLLGIGLFAAGASSAITAPLAAAITARSVLAAADDPARWADTAPRYRFVWGAVMATGVTFGLAEVQPIPAIIAAQALNGVVLPFVAVFLFIAVNDRALMGDAELNRGPKNGVMAVVVFITIVLGVTSVMRAAGAASGTPLPTERTLLGLALILAVILAVPITRAIVRRRAPAGRLRRG